MSAYESFLQNAPAGIEVIRENGNIDVNIASSPSKKMKAAAIALINLIIGGRFTLFHYPWSTEPHECYSKGHGIQTCSQSADIIYFSFGIIFLIVGVLVSRMAVKIALSKTVVRIDTITGNFSIFVRPPFGEEEKHRDYSRERAYSRIKTIQQKNSIDYYLAVYPSREASKKDDASDEVFIGRNWNQERCEWVHQLILSIQGKSLSTDFSGNDSDSNYNDDDLSDQEAIDRLMQ